MLSFRFSHWTVGIITIPFKKHIYLFWGCQALVAACGIFPGSIRTQQSPGRWDLGSPTRDRTRAPAWEGEILTTGLPGKFQ